MNNVTQIYVGDSILDLFPDTIVAISLKSASIADLRNRLVSVTNSFKIPFTENNDIVFGYARHEHSNSSAIFTVMSGRIIQNGITVMPSVNIRVEVNEDYYKVYAIESIEDLFSTVRNKTLKQIQPITESGWEASDIDSARLNTDGIVTAVLNWGKAGAIYQYDYFLPCFYYHTLVTEILESTGMTLSGDILTDTDFTDLVVPFMGNKWEYSAQDAAIMTTRAGNTTPMADQLLEGLVLDLQLVLLGQSYLWDLTNNQLVIPDDLSPIFDVQIVLQSIDNIIWGGGDALRGRIYRTRDGVTTQVGSSPIFFFFTTSPQSETNVSVSFTNIIGQPGDRFEFRLDTNSGAATGQPTAYAVIITGVSTVDRADVNWNALWNDSLKCESILKDFFVRFGVVQKYVSGTIYLKTLNEIIANRSGAVDWSGKLVNRASSIHFPDYAQENYFKYQSSSDALEEDLGLGTLEVINENLPLSKDYFTSEFQNSNTPTGAYTVASVLVYNADSTAIDEFAEEPGIRLLTLKARTSETAITFNVSARTDYKLAYFLDSTLTKDTGFQYFIDNYYNMIESAFEKGRIITKWFNLNEVDISAYDPHKMIYDGEGYYLINEIKNFVQGQLTKVELFKIA